MYRLCLIVISAIALLVPAATPVAALPATARAHELVIKLRDERALARGGLLDQIGARGIQPLGLASQTYRVTFAPGTNLGALLPMLQRNPAVAFAEANVTRAAMRTVNDPVATQQWALRNLRAYEAWEITTGGAVTIAILDTGVSPSHPDLAGKVLPGFDATTGGNDSSDWEGHGTYTAGVAAARGDNGTGIAGICWGCNILPVRVLGSNGRGDDATIATGIRWAADHGARIISMSLGGPEDTQVLRDAVQYARERNVLLIASSGNGHAEGNLPNYPAAYPGVIAVSATGGSDVVTGFSTTGDFVDIAAPGVGVWSTLWLPNEGDTYGAANGTSASCPHVAGAAALVLTLRPDLTADQVGEILQASADDVGAPGKDADYGYGRLNLLRAVQMASDPAVLSKSKIQGQVARAGASVTLSSGQQTTADANGFYAFENLPGGAYPVNVDGFAPQQAWLSGTALSVATVNFGAAAAAPIAGTAGAAGAFAAVGNPNAAGVAFFPETGHTLRGEFRDYWQRNGGLPIFGFPTSEEFRERGEDGKDYSVQYFERHRFELHPENLPAYRVLLSRLGDNILQLGGRSWFDFPTRAQQSGCQFFAETGHSLCEPFLSYWRTNGLELDGRRGKTAAESLALFGQPLSEAQIETLPDGTTVVVQWFERARFENHGTKGVLLGLLANELATARGLR